MSVSCPELIQGREIKVTLGPFRPPALADATSSARGTALPQAGKGGTESPGSTYLQPGLRTSDRGVEGRHHLTVRRMVVHPLGAGEPAYDSDFQQQIVGLVVRAA